jgi:uncharacterized Zn finger protein (UPF0148 family)
LDNVSDDVLFNAFINYPFSLFRYAISLTSVCAGQNCSGMHLMQSTKGCVECVVCRGSGDGKDGAYAPRDDNLEERDSQEKSAFIEIPKAVLVNDSIQYEADVVDDVEHFNHEPRSGIAIEHFHSSVNSAPTLSCNAPNFGCNIGESILPSLRSLFAGASGVNKEDKLKTQQEAKSEISHLLAQGWQVSAENCEACDMPLFTIGYGMNELKVCVLCGPVNDKSIGQHHHYEPTQNLGFEERASNEMARLMMSGWTISSTICEHCVIPKVSNPVTKQLHCVGCSIAPNQQSNQYGATHDIFDMDNGMKGDVGQKMVSLVMSGWSVAEGTQCNICSMPILQDPQTNSMHCISCGEVSNSVMLISMQQQMGYGTATMASYRRMSAQNEMQKHLMLGWTISEYNCQSCTNPLLTESFQGKYKCVSCNNASSGSKSYAPKLQQVCNKQTNRGRDPTPSNSHASSSHFFSDSPSD